MSETLPEDIARCDGVGEEGDWREGCEHCLRRTAPRPERVQMIAPPAIIVFECEFLIEQNIPVRPPGGSGATPGSEIAG